jgi:hypothetical protein
MTPTRRATELRPRAPRRGGALGSALAALVFCAAVGVLAWMLLLPGLASARFATTTGGAELRLRGLMGDPFAGRATVSGWTLRASAAKDAPLLARGGPAEILAREWRSALGDSPEALRIDQATVHATELHLLPDARGRWPLLALGASAGLPYERGGPVGESPRVRVGHLRLRVDTVVVLDAGSGRATPVRVDWQGEFHELDHSRPIVAALLAATTTRSTRQTQ